jgi:FKBP-type peptidyl-prolyl cis-trans isomerase SlyD
MKPAIADGHVVTIHYRLTLDDGSIADQSFGGDPLVYLHGAQNIVDAIVPANEGYGDYDPAAEQTAPKSQFPPEVAVGMAFQTRGRNNQPMTVWVRVIKDDKVTITANHPMAGQKLNFTVEVLDVRRATADEKKHGHAHGPGGHHHH